MPVLMRPDGAVQVGWNPTRAVLVHPPDGLTPADLAAVLRSMRSPTSIAELVRQSSGRGSVCSDDLRDLVTQLIDAGVATGGERNARGRAASIRVHGQGPLSDLLVPALRSSGTRVVHSRRPHATVATGTVDLVMLTDNLAADPHIVADLHRAGVPHLQVRVRDGTGLVGPLVIPRVTSCLRCADLHRRDRDPAWPAIAAQLRDTVGLADRATLLATAALALGQVNRVIAAVRGQRADPPSALNATLEFDLNASTITARHWSTHPGCTCCGDSSATEVKSI